MASPSHPFSPVALWEAALLAFPPFRHVSDDLFPIPPSCGGSLSLVPALSPFPALSACAPSHGGLSRSPVPSPCGARVDHAPALGPDVQEKEKNLSCSAVQIQVHIYQGYLILLYSIFLYYTQFWHNLASTSYTHSTL